MNRIRPILVTTALLLALLLAPATAQAQELYTFSLGLLGGFGGSLDADPGDDIGNQALQLNLVMITETKTHLGLRLGNIDLDQNEGFGNLVDAELTYVTVAGEYRFSHSFYESGVYLGLGGYQLEGNRRSTGAADDDTNVGLVLGLTGEFQLTRRIGFLIELTGHWTDLDQAQVFATGHFGLAFHF